MRPLKAGLATVIVTSTILSQAFAGEAPTLVRSVTLGEHRGAVMRPDGAALSVTKEGVILRDPAGLERYVVRLRGNQRVSLAPRGQAFGVATYADNQPSALHVVRFELHDETGARRWTLDKPLASEFRISSQGEWTVGIGGADGMLESDLYLYDREGQGIATWRVPYMSELTLPDGGTRFLAASHGELMSFPYDGGAPAKLGRFEKFAASSDGRWVVLCGAGSFSVFDGSVLAWSGKAELAFVHAADVSDDGRFVVLAGGDQIEFADRKRQLADWTASSGSPSLRFMSVAVDGDPPRVLCGLDEDAGPSAVTGRRHTSGAVFLFDANGELNWRDSLSYDTWNFQTPSVEFDDEARQFEVVMARERRHYSLP